VGSVESSSTSSSRCQSFGRCLLRLVIPLVRDQFFCSHCQEATTTDLKVVTCDIDQAFESCRNSTITPAWGVIQPFYQAKYQDNNVLVARGRKNKVRHGQKGFSRVWWGLTQGALLRALLVTAMMTMVAHGNTVLVLDGLSIGGMVSAAAVAIRLAAEEAQSASLRGEYLDHVEKQRRMSWLRYFDDLISVSYRVCCKVSVGNHSCHVSRTSFGGLPVRSSSSCYAV